MKKHSPRPIPDFSRHPHPHPHALHAPAARADDEQRSSAPLHTRAVEPDHRAASRDTAAPPARVKPHATSQKSGRRGQ